MDKVQKHKMQKYWVKMLWQQNIWSETYRLLILFPNTFFQIFDIIFKLLKFFLC